MGLKFKIKNEKFQVGLFDKSDSFSTVRMPDKPSNINHSAISVESLRIARASNNPDSFSTEIKLLVTRMNRPGVSIEKIDIFILKCFSKRLRWFSNICKKQEMWDLVS